MKFVKILFSFLLICLGINAKLVKRATPPEIEPGKGQVEKTHPVKENFSYYQEEELVPIKVKEPVEKFHHVKENLNYYQDEELVPT